MALRLPQATDKGQKLLKTRSNIQFASNQTSRRITGNMK